MAQLVKLYDYISRYESNPFHYPTQFIRLKQENWQKLIQQWEMEKESVTLDSFEQYDIEHKKSRLFQWNPFAKKDQPIETEPIKRTLPVTKKQLTQQFLNELYPFQLKWASSTISHVSFTDQKYNQDYMLKTFLQRLPDIYLVMYYPIFNIKQAPVDGEIILISPIGIEIITVLNKSPDATIIANDDRSWSVETESSNKKVLSPVIPLKRTEQIVRSILNRYEIDINITKTIFSHTNNFLFHTEPYNTTIIGKRDYDKWLEEKRNLHSPLKSVQLKAMEALLQHCQSSAIRRPEWQRDDDEYMTPASFEEM